MDTRHTLLWISAAAETAAFVRIVFSRSSKYRFFLAFLGFDLLRTGWALGSGLDPRSEQYRTFWLMTEPVLLGLQIAATAELYTAIASHYRNFAKVGASLALIAATVAVGACIFGAQMNFHLTRWRIPSVQWVMLAKNAITLGLAVFLTPVACFLALFRVPIRRNVAVHGWLLAAYFVANAIAYFGTNVGWSTYGVGVALFVFETALFLAWATLIRNKGEYTSELPPPSEGEVAASDHQRHELKRLLRGLKSR